MPTITKRNNTYRIRVSCGYDTSGKQIVKSLTWSPSPGMTARQTEKELAKAAAAFEAKVQSGDYVDASNTRLADFCDQYLEMSKNLLSPTTLHLYEYIVREIIKPTLGHMRLVDIKPVHVQRFIDTLSNNGKLSPTTVRRYFTAFKAIMAKAYKLELIDRNPSETARLDLPQADTPEIEIFTKEEAAHMLSCLDSEPLKFKVLVHLAIVTGARRGELVALKWDCVDLKRGTVCIRQSNYKLKGEEIKSKKPKTKSSVRDVAIPAYLVEMLRDFRIEQLKEKMRLGDAWHDTGYLFCQWDGEPMNPNTPTDYFADFLRRNDIPHRKFHALRHTSATLLLTSGTNIKTVAARLGHTQLSTTNRYVHALRDADEAAAETFAELIAMPESKEKKKAE